MKHKITSFEELLIHELKDLYDAENQLIHALPTLAKEAENPELKEAIKQHLEETKHQATRLEKILKMLKIDHKEKQTCKAMEGLVEEAQEVLKEFPKSILRDAAIIGAAQRVEHYEIAGYGTAKAHAKLLDLNQIVELLDETLEEESAADKKLTKIAEGTFFTTGVNKKALS